MGETLAFQLIFACFTGVLAIGGLWVISQAVIQENMQKWAQTWIAELEQLGAPLYNSQDEERFLRIENYIANFHEIALVRYYGLDGALLFSDTSQKITDENNPPILSGAKRKRLHETIGTNTPYLLDDSRTRDQLFIVRAPVWIESMNPGELLNLDLEANSTDEVEVVGFVELGLDFSLYQDRLVTAVLIGTLVYVFALLLMVWGGRYLLKGALKPLADLEIPLSKLAAGDTEVNVGPSGHREILAIHNALRTTVNSLNQRDKMLRRLADYDSLTGLPNRRYFTQELEDQVARTSQLGTSSALLFIDLDQFKYVNDSLGHAVGDRVLVQASYSLKENLRKNDMIARFGGDEFTVLLKDIDKQSTIRLVEDLMKIMQDVQFIVKEQSLSILCSIGVTMIDTSLCTPDELLAQADFACHEAKACGRNQYKFYEVSSQEKQRISVDMGWTQRIKNALKDESFLLHYQPIVQLDTGHTPIYEVLLRLRGKNDKVILPAAFMSAANRFGLMVDIDHFVIRSALEALARHQRQGHDVRFAVNLSGYVFNDMRLVNYVGEHLEKNRLDPTAVIFEITEQVAVRQLEGARELIKELMALGCRFALDDFGTGFSSFNYLKHLPVDYIKIDGGFIRNMANDPVDRTMVKSIMEIAKAAGKETIAEYVNDGETLKMLCDLGIDYAQGFYIGEPAATLSEKTMDSKKYIVC